MKRVVITGMGMISPLGAGVAFNWGRLIRGDSGIVPIKSFDTTEFSSKIGGLIPTVGVDNGASCDEVGMYNPAALIPAKTQRKMSDFSVNVVLATEEAIKDAAWYPDSDEKKCRTGVIVGSGLGGFDEMSKGTLAVTAMKNLRRLSPFFLTNTLINMASGQVSIRYGFKGPNHAVSCGFATGSHVMISAAKMIMLGDADVMVAGASEMGVKPLPIGGFCAANALSTHFNDQPEKASRPWDKDRDGFVPGDGAGVLILEEYEHAKKRGAKIYAELSGYGMSGDAHHITDPPENGGGAYRSMQMALKKAGSNTDEIGYINAHATSTVKGDQAELSAVKQLFHSNLDRLSMSSTKSAIGHLLGAAGAVEAIYTIKALETGILPPTLNLDHVSKDCQGIDLIPKAAKEKKIKAAFSNSFGFGGTNATLLFQTL